MTEIVSDVIHAALQLPETQRIQVLDAIIASLPEDQAEGVSSEWLAEVNRRSDALAQDPTQVSTWDAVKTRIWRRLEGE